MADDNPFSRIQDRDDREMFPSLCNQIENIVGQYESPLHPDDFIERYFNYDLTPFEQQKLHDFYRVCLWWQRRESEAGRGS